jgi:hypothetical protein
MFPCFDREAVLFLLRGSLVQSLRDIKITPIAPLIINNYKKAPLKAGLMILLPA